MQHARHPDPCRASALRCERARRTVLAGWSLCLGLGFGSTGCTTTDRLLAISVLQITSSSTTIGVGQTTKLVVTATNASGTPVPTSDIEWESSDTAVAVVDGEGSVTGRTPGAVVISASTPSRTGQIELTVAQLSATGVAVTPSSAPLNVGQTVTLTAIAVDVDGNVVDDAVFTWSSSNPSSASVDANGTVSGVAVGSATITAQSGTRSGSAMISVTDPSTANPNEPSGFSAIAIHTFTTAEENGWSVSTQAPDLDADPSSPGSPPSIGRFVYAAGSSGGSAPAQLRRDFNADYRALYLSVWVQYSSNWSGHPSGTNTLFSFSIDFSQKVTFVNAGTGNAPLAPRLQLQSLAGTFNGSVNPVLTDNTGSGATIQRGMWHRIELVIVANQPGQSDGEAHWWLDGEPLGSYTGIPYIGASATARWQRITLSPEWGGGGGSVASTQSLAMDDLFLSGASTGGGTTGPATSVVVTPSTAGMAVGRTLQLTARALDAGGNEVSGRIFSWTSRDTGIATVNGSGLVTSLAEGTLFIVAETEGLRDSASVNVSQAGVASVGVTPATATLVLTGGVVDRQFQATVRDNAGQVLTGRPVTWSSSNSNVASVNQEGLVTAAQIGSTTITATSEGQQGQATANVVMATVTTVDVAPRFGSVRLGSTVQLVPTVRDQVGGVITNRQVNWATSDPGIADVDASGLVTPVDLGPVTITATETVSGVQGTSSLVVVDSTAPTDQFGDPVPVAPPVASAIIGARQPQPHELVLTPLEARSALGRGRLTLRQSQLA